MARSWAVVTCIVLAALVACTVPPDDGSDDGFVPTLPVPEAKPESLTGAAHLIAEVVFDLDIADTGTRFERCRYYFVVTRPRGDLHVESMNVGVRRRPHPDVVRLHARFGEMPDSAVGLVRPQVGQHAVRSSAYFGMR